MSDSDDEPLTLSSHALAALAEFNAEKEEHQSKFDKLQAEAEANGPISMDAFTEDWNESQFWYSDETANLLATRLLERATPESTIGVVSAPSVFVALKNIVRHIQADARPKLLLLEHDDRFGVFSEYQFYDFNQPFKLPAQLKGSVDHIICDPPFLSEDCQTKAALTTRWLLKPNLPHQRIIVCTGERMENLIVKLYKSLDVKTTTFEPHHARGLSNEFYCYSNFECEDWKWRAEA